MGSIFAHKLDGYVGIWMLFQKTKLAVIPPLYTSFLAIRGKGAWMSERKSDVEESLDLLEIEVWRKQGT